MLGLMGLRVILANYKRAGTKLGCTPFLSRTHGT